MTLRRRKPVASTHRTRSSLLDAYPGSAYRSHVAKCAVCNSHKGKRQCPLKSALICSLCCGTTRDGDRCGGCVFFKPPSRNYDRLPRYSTSQMDSSEHLQRISFPIEAAICSLDRTRNFGLKDAQAIGIFEVLLDIYAFGETKEALAGRIRDLSCESVVDLVERELSPANRDEIAKVLGAVRFVARRRAIGGRHHVELLHRYCGAFVRPGVGLRRLPDGTEVAVGEL